MPRRGHVNPGTPEPPRKRSSAIMAYEGKENQVLSDKFGKNWKLGKPIGTGGFGEIYEVFENLTKKKTNNQKSKYVAKIEKHSNGPLFVEINCYLRLGKQDMIDQWKKEKNLKFLGMPHFVASGSHIMNDQEKYRFLVIPKYEKDLEAILQSKKIFNIKTVLVIAMQILDVLEYIHNHGYVHSDIKASNIMLGRVTEKVVVEEISVSETSQKPEPTVQKRLSRSTAAKSIKPTVISKKKTVNQALSNTSKQQTTKPSLHNLRPSANINYLDDIPFLDEILEAYEKKKRRKTSGRASSPRKEVPKKEIPIKEPIKKEIVIETTEEQVFLLDYGLATKYLLCDGTHKDFSLDQRRAHAGTVLFCSRDAHKGVPSRRSDLESLAYNMIYWLTGSLPWMNDIEEPQLVEKKKNRSFTDIKSFLRICFEDYPRFLFELFNYLNKIEFQEKLDYNFCRNLFKKAIKDYGFKENSVLDFDALEGWGKIEKVKKIGKKNSENKHVFKSPTLLFCSPRKPLHSNVIFKRPKLRKKIKDKLAKNSMMNWSKILVLNPELILKQAPKRVTGMDEQNNLLELDLDSLNPTQAMREIYDKAMEREGCSPVGHRGDEICQPDNVEGYTAEMQRVSQRVKELRELEFQEAAQAAAKALKVKGKRGRKKSVKKSEPPTKGGVRGAKSQTNSASSYNAKEAPVRKCKSTPLKRSYSLRG